MAIALDRSPETMKELRKWEQHHTETSWNPETGQYEPGNPYVYREYPKMLYKAQKHNGKIVCMLPPPSPYEALTPAQFDALTLFTDTFNRQSYTIVQNDDQERARYREGYRRTQAEAVEFLNACETAMADAAAEALHAAQRMSSKAQAELDTANRATAQHVTDVVGKKGKKPEGVVSDPSQD